MKFKMQFNHFFAIILSCIMIVFTFVFPVVSKADDTSDSSLYTYSLSGEYFNNILSGGDYLREEYSYVVSSEFPVAGYLSYGDDNTRLGFVSFNGDSFSHEISCHGSFTYLYYHDDNTCYKKVDYTDRSTDLQSVSYYTKSSICPYPDSVATNIPYFSSRTECESYLRGEIDTSSAVNSDDLLTYDESVELPQNLVLSKVDKDDAKCYVEWKQSDDIDLTGYQTQIWRKPRYCHVSFMGFGSTSFLPLDMTKYKTVDTRNVNRELIDTFETTQIDYERLKAQYSDETWTLSTTTLDNCQYFIRNVKNGKYVSNWVRVIFTNDGWYIKDNDESLVAPGGSYDELPATDENGNLVSDPSTQEPVPDSPYNPDYVGVPDNSAPELNTDGILSFVKDLFSENGIVGIVKVIIGWMPAWMVAFISLFFTMLIALMIYRVVRG